MTNVLNLQRDAILIANVEDVEDQNQSRDDAERQEQRNEENTIKIEFSNFKCSEILRLDF